MKGILSADAARRIGRADLAGAEVEYNILHAGLAGEVRRGGALVGRCVDIGEGIIPMQEEEKHDE